MEISIQDIHEMINNDMSKFSFQEKIQHLENIIEILDKKLDDDKLSYEDFCNLIDLKRSAMGKLYSVKRSKLW